LNEEKHQATKCNTYWLYPNDRRSLCESRLKIEESKQTRGLGNLLTKASKINGYISNHLDRNGYRIDGTENNASKILKLLNKKSKTT